MKSKDPHQIYADAHQRGRRTAMDQDSRRLPWCPARIQRAMAARLRELLAELVASRSTLHAPLDETPLNPFGPCDAVEAGNEGLTIELRLPINDEPSLADYVHVRLRRRREAGWRLLAARAKFLWMGEARYVQSESLLVLADMAKTEGAHCHAHELAPAPGLAALIERVQIGSEAPAPSGRSSTPRRASL